VPRQPTLTGPAVISRQGRSGLFRARDVRANIRELGFEKGAELSLTLLADELVGIRQTSTELTKMVEQLVGIVSNMTMVNGSMAQQLDTMKRREEQFDENRGQGVVSSSN
jgi:hypothetical protein